MFCNQLEQFIDVGVMDLIVVCSAKLISNSSTPVLNIFKFFGNNLNQLIEGFFGNDIFANCFLVMVNFLGSNEVPEVALL